MGSYSIMQGDLRIKKRSKEKFLKAVEEIRNERPESELVRNFLNEDMKIGKDGYIEYSDYYGNWDGDKEFAKFIAPYVERTDLVFKSDLDERWGYHLNGRGKVCKLYWIKRHKRKLLE